MSVPKLDGGTELIISQSMVAELEEYLNSDVLYWQVAGPNPLGSQMPQLTIGGLLEAFTRAAAAQDALTSAQRQELQTARTQHDRIRAAHAALYTRKAVRELHSRLDAWRANLVEASRKARGVYAQDVRVRAKIYLLEQTLGAEVPAELQQQRERLDQELRAVFVSGEFVWDARLQAAFPKNVCWWLYGHWREESS